MIAAVNLAIREKEKQARQRGEDGDDDEEEEIVPPFSRARQRVLDAQDPNVKDKRMSARIVAHVYGMPVSQVCATA